MTGAYSAKGFPRGKLSSEARLMRNAGGKVTICTMDQTYSMSKLHATPHPSSKAPVWRF